MRGAGFERVLVSGLMFLRLLLRWVDPCEYRLRWSGVHRGNRRRQTGCCPQQGADGCRNEEQQPFAQGRGYFPEARGTASTHRASTHRAARISSTTGEFDRCLQWERHLRVAHDGDSLLPWRPGRIGNHGSGRCAWASTPFNVRDRETAIAQRILLAKLLAK